MLDKIPERIRGLGVIDIGEFRRESSRIVSKNDLVPKSSGDVNPLSSEEKTRLLKKRRWHGIS